MKKFLIISLLALICSYSMCCTGFVFKYNGKLYLCANLDMQAMQGYLILNKRNIEKFSFFANPPNILKWTSKYGSVTFTTIGKDFPFGGMNEKGLTVAIMTTSPMVYPKSDNRYEINESQWVQYILDNFSSTNEVINSDSLVRINRFFDNWHYLICDKNGDIAIIEFKDGVRKVFSGSDIKIPVLENSFYEESLIDLKNNKSRNRLLGRFSKASYLLENLDYSKINTDEPKSMFPILDILSQSITRWQMVYDIGNGNVYYKENTYSYLLKPGSKGFILAGTLGGTIDLKNTDFTGPTLARKLGIVYFEKGTSPSGGKISYPDKTLMPFSKVFDVELLNFNIEIFKSQGAKNITKQIVEKYIQFAKKEDYISPEITKH
jgi:choloylglycine hydrolase